MLFLGTLPWDSMHHDGTLWRQPGPFRCTNFLYLCLQGREQQKLIKSCIRQLQDMQAHVMTHQPHFQDVIALQVARIAQLSIHQTPVEFLISTILHGISNHLGCTLWPTMLRSHCRDWSNRGPHCIHYHGTKCAGITRWQCVERA
jgi:hypothetical protein